MAEPKLEFTLPFTCKCGHILRIKYEPNDGEPIIFVEHPNCEKSASRPIPGVPIEWQQKENDGRWTVVHPFELMKK